MPCGVSGSKEHNTKYCYKSIASIGNSTIEPSTAVEEPIVIKSDETSAVLGHISKDEQDEIMPSAATTSGVPLERGKVDVIPWRTDWSYGVKNGDRINCMCPGRCRTI